jgi:hypothetical protein
MLTHEGKRTLSHDTEQPMCSAFNETNVLPDQGMMNNFLVSGIEGTAVDAKALLIDNKCFTGLTGRGFTLG